MKQHPLTGDDHNLIKAAVTAADEPVRQLYRDTSHALVTSALRLEDGQIITAHNIIADVGSLSECAEPIAISSANKQPDKNITTIVAVYHEPGHAPKVIPPCGRCREFITDYARNCMVILREPESEDLFKVTADKLLPYKYADYWKQKALV